MRRFLLLIGATLAAILLFSVPALAHTTEITQAESMTTSSFGVGAVLDSAMASDGKYFLLRSNVYIYKDFHLTDDSDNFVVRA